MKKLITFCLSFVFAFSAYAQTDSSEYYNPQNKKKFSKENVSVSVAAGAGVASNNSSYSFIAPKVGYRFSPQFKLNVGLMHYSVSGNSLFPLTNGEGFYNRQNQTANGNIIFVEGQYLVKPRWIVSGGVMMDMNSSQKQNNFKALSFGAEYKVSKHSSIRFQSIISEGQGNYYLPGGQTGNNPNAFPLNGFNSFGTGFSNSMFR